MGWQRGEGDGAGEEPEPDGPDPAMPDAPGGQDARRDGRLAGFALGGKWDTCLPGPELAAVAAAAAGPQWRCPGAEPGELTGVLGRLAALESWAAAGRLGVIREMIRQDDLPFLDRPRHGDLPDEWSESVDHELALALASSAASAQKTAQLAWDLEARLPGTGRLLTDGVLTYSKARLISETFQYLSDEDAARAEELLLPELTGTTGKTYGQIMNLAVRIANQADPHLAERRRKAAVKHTSRVRMYREQSGAAGLTGRDLPTDETLAAYANVNARAAEYKESGAFPDARMDQLRATAYLDLLNGITAWERIAHGQLLAQDATPQDETPEDSGSETGPKAAGPEAAATGASSTTGTGKPSDAAAEAGEPASAGCDPSCRGCDRSCDECECGYGCPPPGGTDPDDDAGPGGGEPSGGRDPDAGDGGPGNDSRPGGGRDLGGRLGGGNDADDGDVPSGDGGPGHGDDHHRGGIVGRGQAPAGGPVPFPLRGQPTGRPVLSDLVLPLATLLGLADRPGEAHGLGILDPDLCRDLAALAAASPHTQACITVTDADGIAIGHGCVRSGKMTGVPPGGPPPPLVGLPARLNLTITAARLSGMLGAPCTFDTSSPRAPGGWALAPPDPRGSPDPPGDPDWCGPWALTLPGGLEFTVRLEPVPTFDCDHRNESHTYQPNDRLRHLVQVRDHTCTFPPCSRHARESDFEHAVPYHKGGRTCACNAGARSRKCHRIKQSHGWNVTQPRPGWHQWTTPSGRTYTQAPYRYPV